MAKGRVLPSEAIEHRDDDTGRRVIQITDHNSINHHLYPLTRSFTPDGKWVIFASNRTGVYQFYKAAFPTGPIVQLTDDPKGVNGYSGHISADGSELFFTAHGQVRAVHLETLHERTLAVWDDASIGEINLSSNGHWWVTALKRKGLSYLAVGSTDGATAELIWETERTLIHPQFCPIDDQWIEYAQDPAPRMWLIRRNGSDNVCLYDHDNNEFIVHETWLGSSWNLIFVHWSFALKIMGLDPADGVPRPTFVQTLWQGNAWHIAPNKDGTKVLFDTNHPNKGIFLLSLGSTEPAFVCQPYASCQGTQWAQTRYATKEDFERAGKEDWALSWMEAKVDTVYGPQWTHPHPSWSPDEKWCLFDSDRTGTTQVYAVELAEPSL
ncbi:MAG: oligogalacturonate lyase family protein [Armatimonadetes bacterium]|nr:oligogalacturonate lyase family protein [Armatimonadota bacterium]MDW8122122.1 oligogalacturonate lyase family protein [Armatimonadota bacterium]